jgi:hypothetical protein
MGTRPPDLFDAASNLDGPPQGGAAEAWIYGVAIAGPVIAYGLVCALTRHAWFVNLQLKGVPAFPAGAFRAWTGASAVALGIVFIGIGSFAHFHWFWSNYSLLSRYYEVGKIASLLVLVVGIGWWIVETVW